MQIFEGESEEIKRDGYEITTPKELPEVEQKPKDRFGREISGGRDDRGDRYGNNKFGNGRDFSRGGGRNFGDRRRDRGQDNQDEERDTRKIYIANLNYETQVKELRDMFEERGFHPSDVYIVEE